MATDRVPLVLTAAQVAVGAGGRLRQGPADLVVGGFTTDSRRIVAGQFEKQRLIPGLEKIGVLDRAI